MTTRLTLAHLGLALLLFSGCHSSHSGRPDDCPPIAGSCMDDCCLTAVDPVGYEGCTPVCPGGTRLVDRCAPAPGCGGDGGVCVPPPVAPPTCTSGPCCTETHGTATWDCTTLEWVCGEGSPDCNPDPRVRCPAPYLACEEPTDCVLASATCCGPCERTLDNSTSVNRERIRDFFDSEAECGTIGCAPCPDPSTDPLRPRVFPTCGPDGRGELCAAFDLRDVPFTECTTDADCRVRTPDCCECGGAVDPSALIALRVDGEAAFAQRVCPSGTFCPECLPAYPPARAYCAADGHCAVEVAP